MLKNKTKDELLELLYKANAEIYDLQMCNNQQSEVLKKIAELYLKKGFFARLLRFFALPFKILQVLKTNNDYFLNILNKIETMNLTKEQVIEAKKMIVAFENQKIAVSEYKKAVVKMLGISENCSSCGDVAGRLHDDFQKRISEECKTKFPELLPTPPVLKSGQFSGATYAEWLKTYHFKGLDGILSKMKAAALAAKNRGVFQQYKLISDDIERVKEFIQARKLGLETGEETTGVVDLDSEDISEIDLEKVQKELDEEVEEIEKGVLGEVEEKTEQPTKTTEAEKQKKIYTNEEAKTLYDSGMTLQDLGVYYGCDASTIKRRLDKYNAILEAANKDLNEGE